LTDRFVIVQKNLSLLIQHFEQEREREREERKKFLQHAKVEAQEEEEASSK
jgi:hypothetical protein